MIILLMCMQKSWVRSHKDMTVDPPRPPPLPPGPAPQRLPDVDRATVARVWGPSVLGVDEYPENLYDNTSLAESLKNDAEFLKLSKTDRIHRYQELLNSVKIPSAQRSAGGLDIKIQNNQFKSPSKRVLKEFKRRKRAKLINKLRSDLK